MRYTLANGRHNTELSDTVNELLATGWNIAGPAFYADRWIYQPMLHPTLPPVDQSEHHKPTQETIQPHEFKAAEGLAGGQLCKICGSFATHPIHLKPQNQDPNKAHEFISSKSINTTFRPDTCQICGCHENAPVHKNFYRDTLGRGG